MKIYYIFGEMIVIDHLEMARVDKMACIIQMTSGNNRAYFFENPADAINMRNEIYKLALSPEPHEIFESKLRPNP
ncbi:hypothetical protein G5Y08_002597 [Vibrio parahaemolyticus]|nr:hypothetical protein [Vibrio parahaemolyticus]EHH2497215.1 hypothetical protein [Vibrio parahaemolyticus]EID4328491.1 hypothetical protein [Vibrio parahaemolyticus]